MPIKLNTASGGGVILTGANTATDKTITVPAADTTMVGTDSTQTLSNKTFSGAQTFGTASLAEPSGSAPLYLCRAWVNFNGTGTIAIRASGNVSSITDGGVGIYTVNFTTAMPDANYVVNVNKNCETQELSAFVNISTLTTSGAPFRSIENNVLRDVSTILVAILR